MKMKFYDSGPWVEHIEMQLTALSTSDDAKVMPDTLVMDRILLMDVVEVMPNM